MDLHRQLCQNGMGNLWGISACSGLGFWPSKRARIGTHPACHQCCCRATTALDRCHISSWRLCCCLDFHALFTQSWFLRPRLQPKLMSCRASPAFLVGWISAKISGCSSFSSLGFDCFPFALAQDGHPHPWRTREFMRAAHLCPHCWHLHAAFLQLWQHTLSGSKPVLAS